MAISDLAYQPNPGSVFVLGFLFQDWIRIDIFNPINKQDGPTCYLIGNSIWAHEPYHLISHQSLSLTLSQCGCLGCSFLTKWVDQTGQFPVFDQETRRVDQVGQ